MGDPNELGNAHLTFGAQLVRGAKSQASTSGRPPSVAIARHHPIPRYLVRRSRTKAIRPADAFDSVHPREARHVR